MSAVLENPAYAEAQGHIDREGDRAELHASLRQRLKEEFIGAMLTGPLTAIRAPGKTRMSRTTLAAAAGDDMAGDALDEAVSVLIIAAQGNLADPMVRAELHLRAAAWWSARAESHAEFYGEAWAELVEEGR